MRTLNKLPIPNISSVKVLVAYSAIAVFFTWPLILHLSDYVIGPFLADNLEYVWKLWWVKHAVLDLKVSPWLQPDIYYPYGYNLAFGEMTPIHTFLGIPITAIIGAVPTYNLFIILSSILTGFFTYFLGLEIGFG